MQLMGIEISKQANKLREVRIM